MRSDKPFKDAVVLLDAPFKPNVGLMRAIRDAARTKHMVQHLNELLLYAWRNPGRQAYAITVKGGADAIIRELLELRTYDAFQTECIEPCCIPADVVAAFEAHLITDDETCFEAAYAYADAWRASGGHGEFV